MQIKKSIILILSALFFTTTWAQEDLAKRAYIHSEAALKQKLFRQIKACNLSQTDNQRLYDVISYDLNLRIDPDQRMIYGKVTMVAMALSAGISNAELNFLDNMEVDSVLANGAMTGYVHRNDILTIQLPGVIAEQDIFDVTVVYHGSPEASGLGSFGFDAHNNEHMIWSLSEPFGARNWWPCKDIPEDKADSVDMRVTVPSDLIVASNGLLREKVESDGWTTFWWHEGYPITTYLVSVAIYPYYVYSDWYVYNEDDSMEVQFYVYPDNYTRTKNNYAKVVDMIKVYSNLFGQYPFIKEKYGHADFIWSGGMEHQTITSLGYWSEDIIAHELAHMWWGDMITCDSFHHLWLNEGFAVYCEALWVESKYGAQGLHQNMAGNVYLGSGTIYVEDPETTDMFGAEYGLTYLKASWVLHMLRHVVGDSTFFDILRTYYETYKFKTATTEQFRDLCTQVSGVSLNSYFQQWIYQSGFPEYEYNWIKQPRGDGTFKVTGVVKQSQPGGVVFEMPIDINIRGLGLDTTFVFWNRNESDVFQFIVNQEPSELALDPDNWILKRTFMITEPELRLISSTVQDSIPGNQNAKMDPGEKVALVVEVTNFGALLTGVSAELECKDAAVTILSDKAYMGDFIPGTVLSNKNSAFEIEVNPSSSNHLVKFLLILRAANGNAYYVTFYLPLGHANILLVDDDAGHDYEQYWRELAIGAGLYADEWSLPDQDSLVLKDLSGYQALVWFTGDDDETTFTDEEQNFLSQYLNQGGRLFLSGQNIGHDLMADGSGADSLFYTQYLKADFISDNAADQRVVGVLGDPVGHGRVLQLSGQYGAANQTSPSVIQPRSSAIACMKYAPSSAVAGIYYEDDKTAARVVYLAFGLEGAAGPLRESASLFLAQAVTWLLGDSAVQGKYTNMEPQDFILLQNYPNPFNPSTQFRISLQAQAKVQAHIFNTLGQHVATLTERMLPAGWHSLAWDGKNDAGHNVSSGIYVVCVTVHHSDRTVLSKTGKMVKLQ